MFSTEKRLQLQGILRRLATGQTVSLDERIQLQNHADRHPTVAAWLRRARRRQQHNQMTTGQGIDALLDQLDLNDREPDERFNPDNDDLGEWFSGAPSWLRRS